MTYKKLRDLKPEIHRGNPEQGGSPDSRFKGVHLQVPAKLVSNTRGDMALQDLFSKGPLKFENTGRVCGECINFYKDFNIENPKRGRCRARGFLQVSEDTPADKRNDWTDPASGIWFKEFPACPLFSSRDRLSLK